MIYENIQSPSILVIGLKCELRMLVWQTFSGNNFGKVGKAMKKHSLSVLKGNSNADANFTVLSLWRLPPFSIDALRRASVHFNGLTIAVEAHGSASKRVEAPRTHAA